MSRRPFGRSARLRGRAPHCLCGRYAPPYRSASLWNEDEETNAMPDATQVATLRGQSTAPAGRSELPAPLLRIGHRYAGSPLLPLVAVYRPLRSFTAGLATWDSPLLPLVAVYCPLRALPAVKCAQCSVLPGWLLNNTQDRPAGDLLARRAVYCSRWSQ